MVLPADRVPGTTKWQYQQQMTTMKCDDGELGDVDDDGVFDGAPPLQSNPSSLAIDLPASSNMHPNICSCSR